MANEEMSIKDFIKTFRTTFAVCECEGECHCEAEGDFECYAKNNETGQTHQTPGYQKQTPVIELSAEAYLALPKPTKARAGAGRSLMNFLRGHRQ